MYRPETRDYTQPVDDRRIVHFSCPECGIPGEGFDWPSRGIYAVECFECGWATPLEYAEVEDEFGALRKELTDEGGQS